MPDLNLSKHDQDMIAEAARILRHISFCAQNHPHIVPENVIHTFVNSWIITEVKPQTWDYIYDVMHRTGHNK